VNTAAPDPAVEARREFLVRLGPGAGWFLCVLVALVIPPIAVVVLIGCAVGFARACHEGADGGRT